MFYLFIYYYSLCICTQVATTVLSSDQKTSTSAVHPIVRSLANHHLAVNEDDSPAIVQFKERTAADLQRRFCSASSLTSPPMLASALDPRYRDLEFVERGDRDATFNAVKTAMTLVVATEQPPAKKLLGKKLLKDVNVDEASKAEFDTYLSAPEVHNETCPLEWWKENATRYPALSKLAKKILGSTGHVCAVREGIFSRPGTL